MNQLLIVRDWDRHFENNRSRELKLLEWVPVPNRQDGDGYTELLDHPDGAAHFGAWIAIVEIASRCDPRGTLLREDRTISQEGAGGSAAARSMVRPHDSDSLGRMSRIPTAVMESAIPRLLHIGWLIAQPIDTQDDTETPQEGATLPRTISQEGATKRPSEGKGREGKGTEGNLKSASEALALAATAKGDRSGKGDQPKRRKKPEYSPEFQRAWEAYGRKGTKGDAAKRFDEAVKLIAGRDDAPADPTQWLIERTATYAPLHDAGNEKKFRKDYERWLKGKGYDFDEKTMRQEHSSSLAGSGGGDLERGQQHLAHARQMDRELGDEPR